MNLIVNLIAMVAPGIVFYGLLHFGAPIALTVAYFLAIATFAVLEAVSIAKRRKLRLPQETSKHVDLITSA